MFPCNSNSNYQPFPSTYYDDENPYSSHHQYNNYAYPSLLEDDGVILSYLLSQQQQEHLLLNAPSGTTSTCQAQISVVASNQDLQPLMDTHAYKTSNNMSTNIDNGGDASTKAAEVPARKRRTGKKDRHSKICTAQGPRDRRMRLSLPIARNFFDLQEMLGFDKASKTIEWLFTKSKTAITELKQHLSQGLAQSSSSNKTIATRTTANAKPNNSFTTSTESSEVVSNVSKKKMMVMRKFCTVAKESRAEARARARERTKEKMRIRSSSISSGGGCFDDHHPHQVNPNHFCTTQQMTNCAENHTRSHQLFGANSEEEEEEDEFPGFHGNLGINNSKMQSTSILPYTTSNNSNALQLNPSSILINPNSSFLNTDSAQETKMPCQY